MQPTETPPPLSAPVGKIGAPHGVHGWVKVHSFTDPEDNLLDYSPWWLETRSGWYAYTVQAHKRSGGFIVVELLNCTDRETAKKLTNTFIYVPKDQLPPLQEDEFYWADLVGLSVITTHGETLGKVDSLIPTGANDVLVIRNDQEEILIPYIKQVIVVVRLKDKTITVDWEL